MLILFGGFFSPLVALWSILFSVFLFGLLFCTHLARAFGVPLLLHFLSTSLLRNRGINSTRYSGKTRHSISRRDNVYLIEPWSACWAGSWWILGAEPIHGLIALSLLFLIVVWSWFLCRIAWKEPSFLIEICGCLKAFDVVRQGRVLWWDLDWFFYLGYCTSNESPILEHITTYITVVILYPCRSLLWMHLEENRPFIRV